MTQHETLTRQKAIKKLLNEMLISDQETLVGLLKTKFEIETNQSVVSRDLHKLGVIKKKIDQMMVYEIPNLDSRVELLKLAVIDINHNEVMIAVKTHPGLAAFVGDYLDQEPNLDILGCLAGENIVFIAVKSIENIEKIYHTICQSLHFKKN